MSSNKVAKQRLIDRYGAECFINKLKLRQDSKPRIYKTKAQYKRMKQLTYHHILERRNGGKATVENGALLSAENHEWFHKQSGKKQKAMNEAFQEYKHSVDMNIGILTPAKGVTQMEKLELTIDMQDCVEIEVKDYDRAKYKQHMQQITQEYVDR